MACRKPVVSIASSRVFLATILTTLLALFLLVDNATYAQTESKPVITATPMINAVELSWSEVSGATHYELYTWWDASIGWKKIGGDALTDTTYTHEDLDVGLKHYYSVRGLNANGIGVSGWSNYVDATPFAAQLIAMAASSLTDAIELLWISEIGAARYELWTWWDASIGWKQIGGDNLIDTNYMHKGVTAGIRYYYTVRGLNADGVAVTDWSTFIHATLWTKDTDREVLVAFYNATGGSNWVNNTNWLSDKPLDEWHGITTDEEGRVVELTMWDNEVKGQLPSELSNLTNLRVLDIPRNKLVGSISPELSNLSNLEILRLWGNDLDGTIPPELSNLSRLRILSLSDNKLTGPIPSTLRNLSNLEGLGLAGNHLSGPIPPSLGKLFNLAELELFSNQFSGPIPPELGNLSNLRHLLVWENQLSGPIPSELGNLSKLEVLGLESNQLSGSIPYELTNLSKLNFLNLSGNHLTGCIPKMLFDIQYNDLERLNLPTCAAVKPGAE